MSALVSSKVKGLKMFSIKINFSFTFHIKYKESIFLSFYFKTLYD